MTSDSIAREPLGVPEGGQFSSRKHSESPVKLFDRTDGTYFRPPPSATAEHCVEFWSNVSIPDEVVTHFENAYFQERDAEVLADRNDLDAEFSHQWLQGNPEPKREKAKEEYNARFRADLEAYHRSILPGLEAKRPLHAGNMDATQLLRASRMFYEQPDRAKFPGEADKVMGHEVELYNETLTVGDIERKYELSRIHREISREVPRNNTDPQLLEAMQENNMLLEHLRQELLKQNSASAALNDYR